MKTWWANFIRISSFSMMVVFYGCSMSYATDIAEQETATVEIDKEVHFLTSKGEGVVVSPGIYEVQAVAEGLRLTAPTGTDTESIVIDAIATVHQETISIPIALSFLDKEDEHVVVLLLPEGKSLEAFGSSSGVKTRRAPQPTTQTKQAGRSSVTPTRLKKEFSFKKRQRHYIPRQLMLAGAWSNFPRLQQRFPGQTGRIGTETWWRLPVSDSMNQGQIILDWTGFKGKTAAQRHPSPSQIPEIRDIIRQQQCCVQLLINGKRMPTVKMKLLSNGNLQTSVGLFGVRAKEWPKTFQLIITKNKVQKWESAPIRIDAIPISYFSSHLFRVFSHPRCTTCHSLGHSQADGFDAWSHENRQSVVTLHDLRLGEGEFPYLADKPYVGPFVPGGENIHDHYMDPGHPVVCNICHSPIVPLSHWMYGGPDFEGKTSLQVCQLVQNRMRPRPQEQIRHHFHEDVRLLWALTDGRVPDYFGDRPNLPVLFPGDPNAWFGLVDPWVEAGLPCSDDAAFWKSFRKLRAF